MANYCFTKYAIEGKKDVLVRVADAINHGEGWMLNSIENLGLKFDKEEYSCRAEWETGARVEERDGVSVLFFTQAYPWDHVDVIDWVLAELGEPEPNIYMLMQLFEIEIHQTNDSEGKYFPERYRIFTDKDEDDVYFLTKEEALAHIRKQYNLSDDYDTLEKIQEYCDAEDLSLCFDEIEVIYQLNLYSLFSSDEEENNEEETSPILKKSEHKELKEANADLLRKGLKLREKWKGIIDEDDDLILNAEWRMNAMNAVLEQISGLNHSFHIDPSCFSKLQDADFMDLWNNYIKGLVTEHLQGLPDAEERLKEVESAYNYPWEFSSK